jgi:hypothetical protein
MLDQQPGFICSSAIAAGSHQYPRRAQLLTLQSKFQIAFSESILDIVALRKPSTVVPHHHGASAIFPFRNDAFTIPILAGMILYLHRQSFDGRVQRRSLWNCPGEQHGVEFQAKAVVQMRGVMLRPLGSYTRTRFVRRSRGRLTDLPETVSSKVSTLKVSQFRGSIQGAPAFVKSGWDFAYRRARVYVIGRPGSQNANAGWYHPS